MSEARPKMRIRPRLATRYYVLCWSLTPLMGAAALANYYTEGNDLDRALYTAGLGLAISIVLHGLLVVVQRIAIRNQPCISRFADTIEFRTSDGQVKTFALESISSVHLEPGRGYSKLTVHAEGGRFSFLYPGSFNRFKWSRFWKAVF